MSNVASGSPLLRCIQYEEHRRVLSRTRAEGSDDTEDADLVAAVTKLYHARSHEQVVEVANAIAPVEQAIEELDAANKRQQHTAAAVAGSTPGAPRVQALRFHATNLESLHTCCKNVLKLLDSLHQVHRRHHEEARKYRGVFQGCIDQCVRDMSDMATMERQFESDVLHILQQLEAEKKDVIRKRGNNPRKARPTFKARLGDLGNRKGSQEFVSLPIDQTELEGFAADRGSRWFGTYQFGSGGMSTAGLWVLVDENDTIIDRVVRKDTYSTTSDDWISARKWLSPLDHRKRQPLEYYLQRKAASMPEGGNVARPRCFAIDYRKYCHRIYLDYCPHGDLNGILENCVHFRTPIPEPVLYYVFGVLVECALVMEQGYHNNASTVMSELTPWRGIIHRDQKPNNVFLDLPSTDRCPRYPTPKLADFGLAFETDTEDPFNPSEWNRGSGTKGYKAPEQLDFVDSETKEPVDAFQLLSWTNVWGIGATLFPLVNGRKMRAEDQLDYLPGTLLEPQMEAFAHEHYSKVLLTLIERCLRFRPEERITLVDLQKEIANVIRTEDSEEAIYMRAALVGNQWTDSDFDMSFPSEDYKLMSFFDDEDVDMEDDPGGVGL